MTNLSLDALARKSYRLFYALVALQLLPALLLSTKSVLPAGSLISLASFGLWIRVISPALLTIYLGCVMLVKRSTDTQAQQRVQVEEQLRREQESLESRIQARTWELETEMKERMRIENLNRGRSEVLEMLAHLCHGAEQRA